MTKQPKATAEVKENVIEPYIETEFCSTTCHVCTDLYPEIFVRNDNEKACINKIYFEDPTTGTYPDLVKAATRCPSGIIHPATPLDPDEPNLEKWIELAKRFN